MSETRTRPDSERAKSSNALDFGVACTLQLRAGMHVWDAILTTIDVHVRAKELELVLDEDSRDHLQRVFDSLHELHHPLIRPRRRDGHLRRALRSCQLVREKLGARDWELDVLLHRLEDFFVERIDPLDRERAA